MSEAEEFLALDEALACQRRDGEGRCTDRGEQPCRTCLARSAVDRLLRERDDAQRDLMSLRLLAEKPDVGGMIAAIKRIQRVRVDPIWLHARKNASGQWIHDGPKGPIMLPPDAVDENGNFKAEVITPISKSG